MARNIAGRRSKRMTVETTMSYVTLDFKLIHEPHLPLDPETPPTCGSNFRFIEYQSGRCTERRLSSDISDGEHWTPVKISSQLRSCVDSVVTMTTSREPTGGDLGRNRRSREETTAADPAVTESAQEGLPALKRHQSDASSPPTSPASLTSPPPKYGSKVYWDDRYTKQFRQVSHGASSFSPPWHHSETADPSALPQDPAEEEDKDTLPYHSWYFTYDELRPLLLPLLLGERDAAQAWRASPEGESHPDDEEASDVPSDGDAEPATSDPSTASDEVVENEEEEDVEVWEEAEDDDDDDDDNAVPPRVGLAQAGPVAVLEIGCGDVPLGAALAGEFQDWANATNAFSIVSSIVCTDYSPVVVDMMRQQYRNLCGGLEAIPSSIGAVPLYFEVTDARKLPYADGSFHLVMEKGTLDAVLSDTIAGVADCVQIVSECARVTSGCIVLISHLNAHTPSGLSWLEEVVGAGLQNSRGSRAPGGAVVAWDVEVHGNVQEEVTPDGGGAEASRIPSGTPGPAVYIIHKKTLRPPNNAGNVASHHPASIAVQFFSYQ
jgi:Methyltransferase domain